MPSTGMPWDGFGGQIFHADMPFHHHHQDTLEAVFQQQPETAALQAPAAAGGREQLMRNGKKPIPAVADAGVVHAAAAAPRKRPFRTDRHSKIRTAQGVRDRRMRLSVGTARDFFALQDRLGYDKPSKTVNWLLTQAKPAIDRLDDAAEPAAALVLGGPTTTVVRGRGDAGSSSSTCCLTADSREEATEKARSRGGGAGPDDDGPPPALMEEQGCGELGWIMSEAAAAAPTTTEQPQQQQQVEGLEYYYQYCLQLEEMMQCNGGMPR